ncbi:MAG: AMP-binding protein [Candidatus Methanomethylophilaceae archaeon]|nr:AMP-binding protein [Candidatus Methanomethylophilaceae archaeon]
MGLREAMMGVILKFKLLSNQVPDDSKVPLEDWIAIKARKTIKKNRELRDEVGNKDLTVLSREDFEKYQIFRVREQMKYAEENVPYYRNKFKDAGVRPEDIRTYDDLTKIPLTEPQDLAKDSLLFYGVSVTKMLREFSTTGTTGHRKSIGFTANDLIGKIDIIASALKGIGMKKTDSLHVMFPMVTAWDPSLMMVTACNILGYGSSVCSDVDIDKQMQAMKDAGSTFIIGLPSFIYRVTTLMGKDVDLRSLGIKKIVSTSEPLSESRRRILEDAWGCKVIDVWGMTEFGLACAVECDEQNGLHTDEANMLLEIIDPETGKHVAPGERGELVITGLHSEGTVLIRYRTRDLAALIDPPCPCGMHFNRRLVKPSGRLDLQTKIGMGYKVYPVLFDEAVFIDPAVLDYTLYITKEEYKDVLTFEIETKDPSDDLAKRIVDSVMSIMEISYGVNDDLIDLPRVRFVEPVSDEYVVKAKKIVDKRENFD